MPHPAHHPRARHPLSARPRPVILLALAAATLTGVPIAAAQGSPAARASKYTTTLDKNAFVSLTETVGKRALVSRGNQPIAYGGTIEPTVAMAVASGGADFTLTYTNTSRRPARLGTIGLTGVRFGPALKYWQFGQDTRVINLKSFDASITLTYPGAVYSPVQVLSDGQQTLGVSLLYPVVDYAHTVQRFTVGSEKQPGVPDSARTWAVGYRLDGELPPGATRTYTLAVRAAPASASWLETVVPYRDYFQRTYGPVKYTRDDRPVLGLSAAFTDFSSPANPRGWAEPSLRPDTNGWGMWATKVRADAQRGNYQRVMLWTPSGVFDKGPANFPFQFMTALASVPKAAETIPLLAALSANGRGSSAGGDAVDLGYWWGHAANVMTTWNPTASHPLNPADPDDARRGFAELDSAVAAGATMVGLDAFQMSRPADLFNWLKMMQARHPRIRFISENAASDLIHNLAPTFHEASGIQNPHVLADFLNPGHETWAAITNWSANLPKGRVATAQDRDAEVQRLRSLGFVPLTYGVSPQPANPADSRSWLRSIPVSLQPVAPAATGSPAIAAARAAAAKGPALPANMLQLARMSDQSVFPTLTSTAVASRPAPATNPVLTSDKRQSAPVVITSAEKP